MNECERSKETGRSKEPGRSKTVPVDASASGCNRDSWMSFRIKEIPSRDCWKTSNFNHRLIRQNSCLFKVTFEPRNSKAFNPFREAPSEARDDTCFIALKRFPAHESTKEVQCEICTDPPTTSFNTTDSTICNTLTWSKFLVTHLTTFPLGFTSLSSMTQLSALDIMPRGAHFGRIPRLSISRDVRKLPSAVMLREITSHERI